MAKKKPTDSGNNLTLRLSGEDRQLFERAARADHFDNLSQWIKVQLRKRAAELLGSDDAGSVKRH